MIRTGNTLANGEHLALRSFGSIQVAEVAERSGEIMHAGQIVGTIGALHCGRRYLKPSAAIAPLLPKLHSFR